MSIQPYKGPGGSESTAGAIVPVGSAHELSEEEYAKRLEDVSPRVVPRDTIAVFICLHAKYVSLPL
jgi:hypothetical protein